MFTRPPQTPLPCPINQIENKRNHSQNDKYPGKQRQRGEHFLYKINLQGNENPKPYPHPLPGFLFSEYLAHLRHLNPFL